MGYGNCNPEVENAFSNGQPKKRGNSQTDGRFLLLFGNRIAEWREDGMYITNCGYVTSTTKGHLNMLPNVSISQRKGEWYLNGELWDGGWIRVTEQAPPELSGNIVVFDETKKYIRQDGWRGYEQPIYAVCGANDTGMYQDSPCRTDTCLMELEMAKKALGTIPSKFIVCESSNIFCIHRYLIVPPSFIEKARDVFEIFFENIGKEKTSLLYSVI